MGRITLPAQVLARARQRLERPTPRVALGLALRGVAHSAMDVSDGLLGDLSHILKASGVGARIDTQAASVLIAEKAYASGVTGYFDIELVRQCTLAGGDDYELVFTAPPERRDAVVAAAQASQTRATRIGTVMAEPGLRLLDALGQPLENRYQEMCRAGDEAADPGELESADGGCRWQL